MQVASALDVAVLPAIPPITRLAVHGGAMVGETANRLLRSADTVSARASILVYCPLPAATATGVPSCEGSCAASRRRALRRLLGRVCALAVLLSA